MGSKKQKTKISFVGESAQSVTGSMYHVEYKSQKILLSCGYYQCKDKLKQYQVNNRDLKFKVKEIEAIIIEQNHLDHYGLLPVLFKKGCRAKVFVMRGGYEFLKIAFEDALKINERDAEYLSKLTKKQIKPLFIQEDVDMVLDNIIECDYGYKYILNEFMSFRFTSAYHIAQSAQVELFIIDKQANYSKKVYYSGDLGNTNINKVFLEDFHFVKDSDICLVESTYGGNIKACNQKTRNKDREKIKTAVDEVCLTNRGTICFPTFASQRVQELLYELYMIYGNDSNFNIKIILDSPLSVKITKMFERLIPEKDKEIWNKILNWNNLNLVDSWDSSEAIRTSDEPKIALVCSGFCEAGRSRDWLKTILPNPKNMVIFCGFSDEGSLATEIKDGKKKYITIDEDAVELKSKVMNLSSFSSHIQHNTMLELYSKFNTKAIYLVHSEMSSRLEFAQMLEDEISRKNGTAKVYIGYKDLVVEI